MSIEESRSKVVSNIWQAIAQSGVDLSTVPTESQARLVDSIANQTLIVFDQLLNDVPVQNTPVEAKDEGDEDILWEGRPFLSLVENYVLTSERIKITRGLVGRGIENFELVRIQDIDLSQGLSERMLNLGDITIKGSDASAASIVLRNISKPEEVYEILRRAWLAARKRHGLQFREYM